MLILILLLVFTSAELQENPYCDLNCTDEPHLLCKYAPCAMTYKNCGPYHFTPLPMSAIFREFAWFYLNEYRFNALSAMPVRPPLNILKYSFELEFIAQCYANMCEKVSLKSTCLKTTRWANVGITIFFDSFRDPNFSEIFKPWALHHGDIFNDFAPWKLLPHILRMKYNPYSFYTPLQHYFAENVTHMGCATSFYYLLRVPTTAVACAFAPVPEIGKPVSTLYGPEVDFCKTVCKCDNKKWTNMCGEKYYNFNKSTFEVPFTMEVKNLGIRSSFDGITYKFIVFNACHLFLLFL